MDAVSYFTAFVTAAVSAVATGMTTQSGLAGVAVFAGLITLLIVASGVARAARK